MTQIDRLKAILAKLKDARTRLQTENAATKTNAAKLSQLATSGSGAEQLATFVAQVEQRNEAFHGIFKRVVGDTQRLIERERLLEDRYTDEVNKRQDAEQKLRDYEDQKLQANFGEEFNKPVHSDSNSPVDQADHYDFGVQHQVKLDQSSPKDAAKAVARHPSRSSEDISEESEDLKIQQAEMEKIDAAPIFEGVPGRPALENKDGLNPIEVLPQPIDKADDMFALELAEEKKELDDMFAAPAKEPAPGSKPTDGEDMFSAPANPQAATKDAKPADQPAKKGADEEEDFFF